MMSKIKIDNVLENRKKSVSKVEKTLKYIRSLIEYLGKLDSLKNELQKSKTIDKGTKSILSNLDQEIDSVTKDLKIELEIWFNLKRRFSRETVNIGVIGRMGQGKSTFLQSITNLSDTEIPASKGQACTSAQSVIYHSPEKQFAKVYFYPEKEFIEHVIKPYYSKLGNDKNFNIGTLPSNLTEISNLRLKSPDTIKSTNAEKQSWYKSFYNVCNNIASYKELLSKPERPIKLSEIKDYVQYKYENNKVSSYKYVAVKKVEIFCQFKNENVDKLGLIDVPGLGDTRLGDEERMIRALGEDVDLILFLKKTDRDRNQWMDVDTKLYDIAEKVLKEKLSLNRWAFMVINNRNNNIDECASLKNTIREKGKIHVIDCMIANVIKNDEANVVLSKTIEYLSNNIENLDQLLINNCIKSLEQTNKKILTLLNLAEGLSKSTNIESRFDKRFEDFFIELRNELNSFRETLKKEQQQSDIELVEKIKEIINVAKNSVKLPPQKLFEKITKGKLSERGYYDELVHNARSYILRNFHELTERQQEKINIRKTQIAQKLTSQDLLQNLKLKSNKEGLEFLELLNQSVQLNTINKNTGLLQGLDFICRFKFSYEGFVQYIVYSTLEQFFPTDIRKLNTISKVETNLNELYLKAKELAKVEFKDESKIEDTLGFIKKNVDDLIHICTSLIDIAFNTGIVTSVHAIAISLKNILNSNDSKKIKKHRSESNIKSLRKTLENNKISTGQESLKILEQRLFDSLDMCEVKLVQTLGNWTNKVSISMSEEFFDHIAYTIESENEWKEYLRNIREDIWSDFKEESILNESISEWNAILNTIRSTVSTV